MKLKKKKSKKKNCFIKLKISIAKSGLIVVKTQNHLTVSNNIWSIS